MTDANRYSYIIKELLESNDSYWIIDKKGIKSEKYLIDPILNFIKNKIIEYNDYAYEMMSDYDIHRDRKEIIIETQKHGCDLIKEIDDGILNKEIIKTLAKHIHHKNTNPLVEEIE